VPAPPRSTDAQTAGSHDEPPPPGFVVLVPPGDRIHFVDWRGSGVPAVLLIHGLGGSTAVWAPVARRLVARRRVVAMDLRGHGLSDAPTEPESYALETLADDAVAVAEGSGGIDEMGGPAASIVLVGHGFGAIVAAVAASRLGSRCARLVLIDGGLMDLAATAGQDVDEFLRGLDEPPEVLRSMTAYLADRRAWDPGSWDDDQERAARAAVVETPAGRLVQATRPHALEASVRAMFTYRPADVLPHVVAPIVAVLRQTEGDEAATPAAGGASPQYVTRTIELEAPGHNLMRYRPAEVTAAILDG
jgi:pimeloyl-ACP methyl ester carboxylesterase